MSEVYTEEFYTALQAGSTASARVVVPILLAQFPSASVVDVGCGEGAWLKEFSAAGIADYLGLDGDYVPRAALKIPRDRFRPTDLRTLSDIGRTFDLACSFEVAEHLPQDCADRFVGALTRAAPVVAFSAAIPGQGGTDHINEQWPTYWADLFGRRGYVAVDSIRPLIYFRHEVEYWYRQNILVFCKPGHVPPDLAVVSRPYDLVRVHPDQLAAARGAPHSGREALAMIGRSIRVLGRSLGNAAKAPSSGRAAG